VEWALQHWAIDGDLDKRQRRTKPCEIVVIIIIIIIIIPDFRQLYSPIK